ncbi:hypothetical protein [Paenibacillus validus]|uniref:Uncharacterized protein n=1 Tax=Paenibacillus validus TaxID=44253 RepID=A0A7X2ZE83_9BACL|nr:hypothetical protein [Paenibacillus validus]MUG73232.1 hypothetical protein [Paenibacillus validus]
MNMYDKAYELARAALLDQIERLPPFDIGRRKNTSFFIVKKVKYMEVWNDRFGEYVEYGASAG